MCTSVSRVVKQVPSGGRGGMWPSLSPGSRFTFTRPRQRSELSRDSPASVMWWRYQCNEAHNNHTNEQTTGESRIAGNFVLMKPSHIVNFKQSRHCKYISIVKQMWKYLMQILCNYQTLLKTNVKLNSRSCLTISSFAAVWPYYLIVTWVLIHTFLHKMFLKSPKLAERGGSFFCFTDAGMGMTF